MLKATIYISNGDKTELWENLTEEEKEKYRKQFAENIKSAFSDYLADKFAKGDIDKGLINFLILETSAKK